MRRWYLHVYNIFKKIKDVSPLLTMTRNIGADVDVFHVGSFWHIGTIFYVFGFTYTLLIHCYL